MSDIFRTASKMKKKQLQFLLTYTEGRPYSSGVEGRMCPVGIDGVANHYRTFL